MEIELVCVRHGATHWNKERRYLGHTDLGLLEESFTELLPLKKSLEGSRFRTIFCSDLKRCRETLSWICPDSSEEAIMDSRLREMDFGEWEGKTYDQLKDLPAYRAWLDDPRSVTPPGGESWEHFHQRIMDFMNSLSFSLQEEDREGRVLIVTHGGVIRQMAAITIPGSSFWDVTADPGGVLTLKLNYASGRWTGTRI
ncbi:histidine phosphatase family protein [Paenibacillus dakarensis]|uniref:histidine phosphatase family protein n=1 Tax=Paenibacillus dakarensis TaxID=1527293 RepID=UPI0006D53E2A|nr:histidine phosphatase family protein [Paenibacillus dakarensis]